MKISSVNRLMALKHLLQQWQVIAHGIVEFYLLLVSQFGENALTGVCQNLPEAGPKFLAKTLSLFPEFCEDLCDLLVLFGRQGEFGEARIKPFRKNRWPFECSGKHIAVGNPCPCDTGDDASQEEYDKGDNKFMFCIYGVMTVLNSEFQALASSSVPAVRLGKPLVYMITSELRKAATTKVAAQASFGRRKSIVITLLAEAGAVSDMT